VPHTIPSGSFLQVHLTTAGNSFPPVNRFLVTFNPLCATFLHVRSNAGFALKLIYLGQATTESYYYPRSPLFGGNGFALICSVPRVEDTR
jgi:hypothetical protein